MRVGSMGSMMAQSMRLSVERGVPMLLVRAAPCIAPLERRGFSSAVADEAKAATTKEAKREKQPKYTPPAGLASGAGGSLKFYIRSSNILAEPYRGASPSLYGRIASAFGSTAASEPAPYSLVDDFWSVSPAHLICVSLTITIVAPLCPLSLTVGLRFRDLVRRCAERGSVIHLRRWNREGDHCLIAPN